MARAPSGSKASKSAARASKGMPSFLPPDPGAMPSKINFAEMFQQSMAMNGDKTQGVSVTSISPITMDRCHGIRASTATRVGFNPITRYKQWIWCPDRTWGLDKSGKFVGRFTNKKNPPPVAVSCTCLDFVYRWEWALTQKGASRIWFCNGEPPDETNPNYIGCGCKHLVQVMKACYVNKF